jgi:hypothetical protein
MRKPWSRPPKGVIKFNVVAAYDADQGKGCMGAIARISMGSSCCEDCGGPIHG